MNGFGPVERHAQINGEAAQILLQLRNRKQSIGFSLMRIKDMQKRMKENRVNTALSSSE